jgi:hypothetical protein
LLYSQACFGIFKTRVFAGYEVDYQSFGQDGDYHGVISPRGKGDEKLQAILLAKRSQNIKVEA